MVASVPRRGIAVLAGVRWKRLLLLSCMIPVALCGIFVASFVNTCAVVADYDGRVHEGRAAISFIGGNDRAISSLRLYVWAPIIVAPHKRSALGLIGECGSNGLKTLATLALRGNKRVRLDAVRALTGRQEREAVGAVIKATHDTDLWVRLVAVEALHHVGVCDEAVVAAEEGLYDEEGFVRRAAAEVLQRAGVRSSIPLLEAAILVESAPTAKTAMEKALAEIRKRCSCAEGREGPPKVREASEP